MDVILADHRVQLTLLADGGATSPLQSARTIRSKPGHEVSHQVSDAIGYPGHFLDFRPRYP